MDARGVDMHLSLGMWAPWVSFALSDAYADVVAYRTHRGLETLSMRVSVWHAIDVP